MLTFIIAGIGTYILLNILNDKEHKPVEKKANRTVGVRQPDGTVIQVPLPEQVAATVKPVQPVKEEPVGVNEHWFSAVRAANKVRLGGINTTSNEDFIMSDLSREGLESLVKEANRQYKLNKQETK